MVELAKNSLKMNTSERADEGCSAAHGTFCDYSMSKEVATGHICC
jgi:hypothetical protein